MRSLFFWWCVSLCLSESCHGCCNEQVSYELQTHIFLCSWASWTFWKCKTVNWTGNHCRVVWKQLTFICFNVDSTWTGYQMSDSMNVLTIMTESNWVSMSVVVFWHLCCVHPPQFAHHLRPYSMQVGLQTPNTDPPSWSGVSEPKRKKLRTQMFDAWDGDNM